MCVKLKLRQTPEIQKNKSASFVTGGNPTPGATMQQAGGGRCWWEREGAGRHTRGEDKL